MNSSDDICTYNTPHDVDKEDLPKRMDVMSNYEKEDISLDQDNEYDYDVPFWSPSNKEQVLIAQFRKLRITNVPEQELE